MSCRKLTQAKLRVLGDTPSLIARHIGADGRARVEQLAPESRARRNESVRRLTRTDDIIKPSERNTS